MVTLAQLATVAAVGALAFWAGRGTLKPSRASKKDINFESKAQLDEFIELFKPVAKHVKENEHSTVSYEMAISDVVENQVLIFERYEDKERDYLQTHRHSAPFLAFREKVQAMGVPLKGVSYYETGIGYI